MFNSFKLLFYPVRTVEEVRAQKVRHQNYREKMELHKMDLDDCEFLGALL